MRVRSKLADVEFRVGAIERKGNTLVIASHPEQSMRSKVYVTPDDVVSFLGQLLRSPGGLLFVIGLPWFWYRARRERMQGKAKR